VTIKFSLFLEKPVKTSSKPWTFFSRTNILGDND